MKKSDDVDESDGCAGQKNLMDAVNSLFAFTFVATRIVLYSVGMIHLFGFGWEEVKQLSRLSGVPNALLGMTCGCMFLGWGLNLIWGYKIWGMMIKGTKKTKTTSREKTKQWKIEDIRGDAGSLVDGRSDKKSN